MGIGKPRPALSRLRVKTPKRTIVPLSVDEVARFWSSFRNSRDLAIVGLMLLQGLRSQEVLDLNRDDLLLSEAQIRVRGKGNKTRFLPLAPEANQLLDHYLRLERPQASTNALFVSLKGRARGARSDSRGVALLVSTPSPDHRRKDGQPPSVPPHLRLRYGARRSQPPGPDAVDGARANPDDDGLRAGHSSRGLSAVCASRVAAHQARARKAVVRLSRYAPLEHPLAHQFQRAVESLTAALSPDSSRQYRGAARHFLIFLGEDYPAVCSLDQLRRDPHILGWFANLRSHTPPLAQAVYVCRLLFLRSILDELAWSAQIPELAHLIRREDIPRIPQRLPRPLTAEQDRLIQQELLRRNHLPANVFLLLRHTGMRIGECADLPYDCLHNVGSDHWAIHVPLGKLKTERMVPVDSFVCELVQRLRFFRSFDPLPDGWLLARHSGKQTLMKRLRPYLSDVAAAVGISTRIVPHQLRHTYASELVRAGVSLPALMTLLGHVKAEMTMKYVLVAGEDLQREFHMARSQPRHLAPQPKAPIVSLRAGLEGAVDSLLFAQHAIEMFRRSLPDGPPRHRLDQLSNRMTKILYEIRKLNPTE